MIARFRTINAPRIIAGWSLIALVAVIAFTGKLKASSAGSATTAQITPKVSANTVEMKRYENTEWKFSIEIPTRWNRFPPASANSPYEVVRFASDEGGIHNLLIVFRQPRDPKMTLSEWSAKVQQDLARGGFGNFATNKTTIGSQEVVTLDFDKVMPDGETWSCRHYFIADDTLGYVLGFGSSKRAEMADLNDRMAKSFQTTK